MNIALCILCILFLLTAAKGQMKFLETMGNFDEYNHKTLNEQVFLHFDREVYTPGDTLWFKAYVRNKSSFRKTGFSNTLYVLVADDEGRIVQENRFLIFNSSSRGQFKIDNSLEDGIYYVTAYSSWMQNFSVDEVFKQRILIHNEFKTSYQLIPAFHNEYYFPGDSVKMKINCYDNFWQKVQNVSFLYRIFSGDKEIYDGSSNIFNGFDKDISFKLPKNISQKNRIEFYGSHNGIQLEDEFEIPVHFTIHVNFFPEGGHLINDMMSKVAFKADLPDGNPIDIEGKIMNEQGKVFTTVKTQHNGMGAFPFLPKKNEKYYLEITKPSGIEKRHYLPEGLESGWTLTASSNNEKIVAGIRNNMETMDTCLLTLMIRGYNFYSQVVPVDKSKPVIFSTDTFPTGIGVLTIFDKNLLPQAERLVFINYDKRHGIKVETDQSLYLPREKVKLDIQVLNRNGRPVNGEYSLSVVDEELGLTDRFDEPNIISGNYFSHEIKGKVINPDYYFKTGSREEKNNLDLLLLTQGWRNYKYLEKVEKINSLPDPVNQNIISGYIEKKRGILKPKRTPGKLNIYYGGASYKVETDENGNFAFIPTFNKGINPNMLLSGFDEQENDRVIVNLDSNHYMDNLDEYLTFFMDSLKESRSSKVYTYKTIEEEFSLNLENHVWIDAVSIQAKKMQRNKDMDSQIIDNIFDKRQAADFTLETSNDVLDVLYAMGLPVEYRGTDEAVYYYYQGTREKIYWYIDGFPKFYNYDQEISYLRPEALKELTILRGPEAEAFYDAPVVGFIRTDPAEELTIAQEYRLANKKVLDQYIMTKEFYKPVYDTQAKKQSRIPDIRKTIHWEPDLVLDSNGRATVTFYNADRYTKVICKIQGISEEGIPAYSDTEYQVVVTK